MSHGMLLYIQSLCDLLGWNVAVLISGPPLSLTLLELREQRLEQLISGAAQMDTGGEYDSLRELIDRKPNGTLDGFILHVCSLLRCRTLRFDEVKLNWSLSYVG